MVWKQDLAKLKQQFKDVGEPKPKFAIPKPVPKLEPAGTIEEEDSLFLNAMGCRQAPAPAFKEKSVSAPEVAPVVVPPSPPPAEDFQAAMGGLKGLKPLGSKIPDGSSKDRPVVPPTSLKEPSASSITPSENSAPATECEVMDLSAIPSVSADVSPLRTGPVLIHLAAGMALEVDGSLDLRGHTSVDALERFRERLQDGVFLGWRTFHITLGASEELRDSFLAFLKTPEAQVVARYAQAPVPMGGNQAWILYYENPNVR